MAGGTPGTFRGTPGSFVLLDEGSNAPLIGNLAASYWLREIIPSPASQSRAVGQQVRQSRVHAPSAGLARAEADLRYALAIASGPDRSGRTMLCTRSRKTAVRWNNWEMMVEPGRDRYDRGAGWGMSHDVFLPLMLVAVGLLLVILEVLLPSWGMIGVAASASLLAGLWFAFQRSVGLGVAMVLAEAVSLPVALGGSYLVWARLGLGRRTRLEPPTADEVDVCHSGKGLDELVGRVGRSVTQLGPSGYVEFGQARVEGVSVDGIVPAGMLVVAVNVRLGRVMVSRHDEAKLVE
jgi:hypothetical protein